MSVIDKVRMGVQADSERAPGPGRKRKENVFIGIVEKGRPGFRYWWSFTVVADNGERKEFRVPRGSSTIIQIDGRQRYGEAPRKGRKIEVKYSVNKDGHNVTTSMRYVSLDDAPQPMTSTVSANATSETSQPDQQTTAQSDDTRLGRLSLSRSVSLGCPIGEWAF